MRRTAPPRTALSHDRAAGNERGTGLARDHRVRSVDPVLSRRHCWRNSPCDASPCFSLIELAQELVRHLAAHQRLDAAYEEPAHGIARLDCSASDVRSQEYVVQFAIAGVDLRLVGKDVETGTAQVPAAQGLLLQGSQPIVQTEEQPDGMVSLRTDGRQVWITLADYHRLVLA